jgi:hypothetical protein
MISPSINFLSSVQKFSTITYSLDNSIISNPERGLQKYSKTGNNYHTTLTSNINVSTWTGYRTGSDKVTVIYRYFMLEQFMSSNINATYLTNMQTDFDRIRQAGLKVIVRFAYTDSCGQQCQLGNVVQQPTKTQILTHITQIAPLLENNKDVILTHQAGFIGTYGEWYYTGSEEFGHADTTGLTTTQWNNRKDVVDAILSATPVEIPIQLRYVAAKTRMYGTTLLNDLTAYTGATNSRIGFYNDAFLNNYGDQGTYTYYDGSTFTTFDETENPVGTSGYNYLINETKYTPMTGETNGLNPPRTLGNNAVLELNLTNFTTLNRDYKLAVITGVDADDDDNDGNITEIINPDSWIASGHYDEIVRSLGYRFQLKSTKFSRNGNNLNIIIDITNIGYANSFKSRSAYIVFKNNSTSATYSYQITTDVNTWYSNVILNQTFDISGLPSGSYNSYIWLPDNNVTLSTRPEYSIRFSNTGTWDSITGYNNLNQTFSK